MSKSISIEAAWAVLTAAVKAAQPTGEVVIPSGKGTNLFVRVDPTALPASIALDLVEQGIRKPLTDISLNRETDEGSWHPAHERRLKRVESWKGGVYAQRGGNAGDEVASQMKVELTEELKGKGVSPKKFPDLFKGNVAAMTDAMSKAGMKFDREELLGRMKEQAIAKLAKRGEAGDSLDLSALSF